jgi:hypothetical protein
MAILKDEVFFEKRGDRYIARATPFSAGYDISKSQKEALAAGLRRIDRRIVIEAVVAFAMIAGLFWTGVLRSQTSVGWILVFLALALVGLTVRSLRLRNRLLRCAVDDRPPDFPRLPLWTALWKPRPPLVAEPFAVFTLRLAVVLLVVLLAGGNILAAIAVIAAGRIRAAAPAEPAQAEEILSLTPNNDAFWLALLLFNLVVAAMIVALGIESRRLRRRRRGT